MSLNDFSLDHFQVNFDFKHYSLYNLKQSMQQLKLQDRLAYLNELKEYFEPALAFVYQEIAKQEKAWEDYQSSLYFEQLRKDEQEMKQRRLEELQALRDSL